MRALTDVEEAEVVARYRAGASSLKLSRRFSVHHSTILDVLAREGVDRRPTQEAAPVDTDVIVRLREDGLSWEKIAGRVGMSPSGVRKRYVGRMGQAGVSLSTDGHAAS